MVAVGSPDGILARNSTGSVALALIAGVANGPPLEARGCEGKRCYRPVRQWPIHPASHAPQAEAAISPQKLDLLGRDFKHAKSARAAENGSDAAALTSVVSAATWCEARCGNRRNPRRPAANPAEEMPAITQSWR